MWRCTASSWIPFPRSGEGRGAQPSCSQLPQQPLHGARTRMFRGAAVIPSEAPSAPACPTKRMFILDREPHSHQPHQEHWDGGSWLGPSQDWAGAGAPQGLPQCPEVGSVPETTNFQGSICWAWDGEFYPMPK